MRSRRIALDYLGKVEARAEALRLFLDRERYDDVIREAHEAIELLFKGALRFVGVDPPRRHDPGAVAPRCGRNPTLHPVARLLSRRAGAAALQ